MTIATKRDIFSTHLAQYLKASKQQKGELLTHVCFVTGLQGKSAVRKFKRLRRRGPATRDRRGRPLTYTPDVTATLKTIWETGHEVCGELPVPLAPLTAPAFQVERKSPPPGSRAPAPPPSLQTARG